MANSNRYSARICYNTLNWEKPSGPIGKSMSNWVEARMGFSFEEWLANPIVFGGYCYAYLPGVCLAKNNADRFEQVDLFLYYRGHWYKQGYIMNVVPISDKEASEVIVSSKDKIRQMLLDVKKNVDPYKRYMSKGHRVCPSQWFKECLVRHPESILNVRFSPNDFFFLPNLTFPAEIDYPKTYKYILAKENE